MSLEPSPRSERTGIRCRSPNRCCPPVSGASRGRSRSQTTRPTVSGPRSTRYWQCVDELVSQGAQRITLAGFPIASQLGRPRVLAPRKKRRARPAPWRIHMPKRRSLHCATSACGESLSPADGRRSSTPHYGLPDASGHRSADRYQRRAVGSASFFDEHRRGRETARFSWARSDAPRAASRRVSWSPVGHGAA